MLKGRIAPEKERVDILCTLALNLRKQGYVLPALSIVEYCAAGTPDNKKIQDNISYLKEEIEGIVANEILFRNHLETEPIIQKCALTSPKLCILSGKRLNLYRFGKN